MQNSVCLCLTDSILYRTDKEQPCQNKKADYKSNYKKMCEVEAKTVQAHRLEVDLKKKAEGRK